MVWIIGLALGPIGEGDLRFVYPAEGGEVILDSAQPNWELYVAKFDQIVHKLALLIALDAEQFAVVFGATELL